MSADSPGWKDESLTACQATASGSMRAPSSRETFGRRGWTAERGTTMCSDRPPPPPKQELDRLFLIGL